MSIYVKNLIGTWSLLSLIQKVIFYVLQRVSNRTRCWYAHLVGVQMGKYCRIYSADFGSEPYLVSLGDHVTVGGEVMFITHDGGVWILRHIDPTLDDIRPIVVEDNVFIGARAIILPGIVIGKNSIVAAGAVVTKHVPPGSVVAGVPARVISTAEAYKSKVLSGVHTKGMASAEKKESLLRLWGKDPEERKAQLFLDVPKK